MIGALFDYAAITGDVIVRVKPAFLPDESDPRAGRWIWSYHIRVENAGEREVQLLTRHWVIRDAVGRVSEVRGDGVVGEQPVIAPGGSFDYVSACPLPTPSGQMQGSYGMIDADGRAFEVAIPAFALVGPGARAH